MTLIHNSLQLIGPPSPPPKKCTVGTFYFKFVYNVFMVTDMTLENVAQCHVCMYTNVCALAQLVLLCCAMLLTHNILYLGC
jgi:hypothetical protein